MIEVGSLYFSVEGDLNPLDRALRESRRQVDTFQSKLNRVARNVRKSWNDQIVGAARDSRQAFGTELEGVYRDAQGKLRNAKGQFVKPEDLIPPRGRFRSAMVRLLQSSRGPARSAGALAGRTFSRGFSIGMTGIGRVMLAKAALMRKSLASAVRLPGALMRQLTSFKTLLAAGLPTIAVGISLKEFAEFEARIKEISTLLSDVSDSELEQFKQGLLELSTQVPQSPDQLGAAAYQAVSAGITDLSEALDITRLSAQAAVAGLTDTETSVDGVTTILNAFGKGSGQARSELDLMFETVRRGKIRFEEIAAGLGDYAAAGATAGVETRELAAVMATVTAAGLKPAQASAALSQAILSLAAPTPIVRKRLKELGFSFTDAAGKVRPLVEIIDFFRGRSLQEVRQLIPRVEGIRVITTLANNFEKFQENMDAMDQSSGAMRQALEKNLSSLTQRVKLATSSWNALLVAVGEKVGEPLKPIIDDLGGLADSLRSAMAEGTDGAQAMTVLGQTIATTTGWFIEQAREIGNWSAKMILGNRSATSLAEAVAENSAKIRAWLDSAKDGALSFAQGVIDNMSRVRAVLADLFTGSPVQTAAFFKLVDNLKEETLIRLSPLGRQAQRIVHAMFQGMIGSAELGMSELGLSLVAGVSNSIDSMARVALSKVAELSRNPIVAGFLGIGGLIGPQRISAIDDELNQLDEARKKAKGIARDVANLRRGELLAERRALSPDFTDDERDAALREADRLRGRRSKIEREVATKRLRDDAIGRFKHAGDLLAGIGSEKLSPKQLARIAELEAENEALTAKSLPNLFRKNSELAQRESNAAMRETSDQASKATDVLGNARKALFSFLSDLTKPLTENTAIDDLADKSRSTEKAVTDLSRSLAALGGVDVGDIEVKGGSVDLGGTSDDLSRELKGLVDQIDGLDGIPSGVREALRDASGEAGVEFLTPLQESVRDTLKALEGSDVADGVKDRLRSILKKIERVRLPDVSKTVNVQVDTDVGGDDDAEKMEKELKKRMTLPQRMVLQGQKMLNRAQGQMNKSLARFGFGLPQQRRRPSAASRERQAKIEANIRKQREAENAKRVAAGKAPLPGLDRFPGGTRQERIKNARIAQREREEAARATRIEMARRNAFRKGQEGRVDKGTFFDPSAIEERRQEAERRKTVDPAVTERADKQDKVVPLASFVDEGKKAMSDFRETVDVARKGLLDFVEALRGEDPVDEAAANRMVIGKDPKLGRFDVTKVDERNADIADQIKLAERLIEFMSRAERGADEPVEVAFNPMEAVNQLAGHLQAFIQNARQLVDKMPRSIIEERMRTVERETVTDRVVDRTKVVESPDTGFNPAGVVGLLASHLQSIISDARRVMGVSDPVVDAPDISVDAPKMAVDAPDMDMPNLVVDAPRLAVDAPNLEADVPPMETPELGRLAVDAPNLELDVPALTVDEPQIRVDVPDLRVDNDEAPEPRESARLPVDVPNLTVNAPSIDLPRLEVDAPRLQVDLPEMPRLGVESPDPVRMDVTESVKRVEPTPFNPANVLGLIESQLRTIIERARASTVVEPREVPVASTTGMTTASESFNPSGALNLVMGKLFSGLRGLLEQTNALRAAQAQTAMSEASDPRSMPGLTEATSRVASVVKPTQAGGGAVGMPSVSLSPNVSVGVRSQPRIEIRSDGITAKLKSHNARLESVESGLENLAANVKAANRRAAGVG